MSPESKNNLFCNEQKRLDYRKRFLWLRAGMIQSIRRFFIEKDYLEVETPLLIPAPPPEIHIDAIRTDAGYLHTSPELCMKRLLASDFPKIFQISKCFRANERGDPAANHSVLSKVPRHPKPIQRQINLDGSSKICFPLLKYNLFLKLRHYGARFRF